MQTRAWQAPPIQSRQVRISVLRRWFSKWNRNSVAVTLRWDLEASSIKIFNFQSWPRAVWETTDNRVGGSLHEARGAKHSAVFNNRTGKLHVGCGLVLCRFQVQQSKNTDRIWISIHFTRNREPSNDQVISGNYFPLIARTIFDSREVDSKQKKQHFVFIEPLHKCITSDIASMYQYCCYVHIA